MELNAYQQACMRTAARFAPPQELAKGALGLASESGELAGLVEKHLHQGHSLDRERMKRELGDALWYLAYLASALELSLEEVAETNIVKLAARYPKGRFDAQDSVHRGKEDV